MDEKKVMAIMLSVANIAAQSAIELEREEKKFCSLQEKNRWSMAEEISYRQLTGTCEVIGDSIAKAANTLKELKERVQFEDIEEVVVMKDFLESMEGALKTVENYNYRLFRESQDMKKRIVGD